MAGARISRAPDAARSGRLHCSSSSRSTRSRTMNSPMDASQRTCQGSRSPRRRRSPLTRTIPVRTPEARSDDAALKASAWEGARFYWSSSRTARLSGTPTYHPNKTRRVFEKRLVGPPHQNAAFAILVAFEHSARGIIHSARQRRYVLLQHFSDCFFPSIVARIEGAYHHSFDGRQLRTGVSRR